MSEPAAAAPKSVQLIAPPGYGAVVPFDKVKHAGLALRAGRSYAWCAGLNAVFVSVVEFTRVALEYPVAFVREPKKAEFVPVAVLGLQDRNLFVDAAGNWRPRSYVPAYFRRHPFCIAEVGGTGGVPAQQLVCVQEDQLVPGEHPLFDAGGEPTAEWEPIRKLLEAVEGARAPTTDFTRRLEALGLMAPFDAVALPRGGQQLRLAGMHRIDEEKLRKLPSKELRGLLGRGELRLAYAHLLSLENFARLLDLMPGAPA